MNFLTTAALTAAVVNLALSLFVFWQNTKAPLHRAYLVWGLSVVLWNASAFVMMLDVTRETAFFAAKLLQLAIIIAPIALFTTSLLVAEKRIPKLVLWPFCALHTFFAGSLFVPGWFITGVHQIQITGRTPPLLGWWSEPGALFWAYTISYTVLLGASIVVLYRAQREAHSLQRLRIRAMLVAMVCIISAGTNDLFPIIGTAFGEGSRLFSVVGDVVQPLYPLVRWHFVPLGNVAACLYMTIVAYSVLQHTLLDVHVTLSRMVAHFIRIGFILLIGLCQLLVISAIAGQSFPAFSVYCALGVLGACAVIASIFFPRLFGVSGTETFERKLLGDRFEYQDKVRSFIASMSWYSDLDLLLDDLHEIFNRSFRIATYQIILRDDTNRSFNLFRAHPDEPARQIPELKAQSPVLRYFEWGKGEYLSLQRHHLRIAPGSIEREASSQLEQFGAQFCFPLAAQSEPFGLLLIGKKISDEPFTATDINLLVSLVKNMSLMVNQIRLKTQILQTQELDLLGRMSRGMAHDLNNLLTPVWTLLQLSGESGKGFDDELLPVAQRNIKTMRAYIREALFFSENLRPDLQFGRLDLVIQQAVDLARASRKKEVEVISVTPGEVLVEMDEVLMQRLIANLISNAIDASRPGAQIHVHLDRLARSDDQDWLRVRVIDQGEGIPKENLNRILKPYFTTKNRGDENRGFGLGLAICRKIVTVHGGNLSIASVLKKGTTVQVDVPSRHPQTAASAIAVPA